MKNVLDYLKAGIEVLYAPYRTFEKLEEKGLRSPWVMMLTLMVITTAVSWIFIPVRMRLLQANLSSMAQNYPMSRNFFIVQALVSGLIAFPIMIFIEALVYYVFAPLADAELGYMDMLQVTTYASVLSVVGQIIKLSLMALTGTTTIWFSPAVFLSQDQVMASFVGRLLAQFDLFAIWSVYIIGIGMAARGKTRRSKALIVTYSVWLVWKIFVAVLSKFSTMTPQHNGMTE